jgi:exodeoxyribonuclease VII small subunit
MAKETKTETFEQTYARLEETVGKLEQGGLTLEESIALYEEGMTLARKCQEMLDGAEQKITKLKESFAPVPERTNGRILGEEIAEYEYIPEEDEEPPPDDPFE